MRVLVPIALLLLTGCHARMRVGSPQFTRYPPYALTCIIVIDENQSAESLKAAADICKEAIEREKPKL